MSEEYNTPSANLKPAERDPRQLAFRIAVGAGVAYYLAMIAPLLLSGGMYTYGDLGEWHITARKYYADCLANGWNFTWSPYLFCGYFIHGTGEGSFFHPMVMLLYRFLPLEAAFGIHCTISMPVMAVGTYMLLRRWRLPQYAAAFGATAFGMLGYTMLPFIHINGVFTFAHTPWILYFIDRVVDAEDKRDHASLFMIGVLTGSQLLTGYPQFFLFSLIVEGWYMLYLLPQWRERLAVLWALGAAKAGGALCGMVQMLPMFDLAGSSGKFGLPNWYYYTGSMHPGNAAQLVSPYLFENRVVGHITHEFALYCGAAVPVLVLWLLLRLRKDDKDRRLILALSLLAAVTFVLALGKYGGLYWLQVQLPVVGNFRFPSRYHSIVQLAAILLATIALARLLESKSEDLEKRLWAIPALAVLTVVLAGIGGAHRLLFAGDALASMPLQIAGVALTVVSVILVCMVARDNAKMLPVLVLVVLADLGIYCGSYFHLQPPMSRDQLIASVDQVPPTAGARTRFASNVHSLNRNRESYGYTSIYPKQDMYEMETPHLRLQGVRYVYIRPGMNAELDIERQKGRRWLTISSPFPRVRMLTKAQVSDDPKEDVRKADIDKVALVSEAVQLDGKGEPGAARIVVDEPGRIDVQTSAQSTQLLVVQESWYNGWTASIGDHQLKIVEAYGDFIGVVVPPGRHDIKLRFSAPSVRYGALLSIIGIVLLVGQYIFTKRKVGVSQETVGESGDQ